MNNLRITLDWEPQEGVLGPELGATWSSMKIEVGSKVVTRINDVRSRSVRNEILVPAYPLAEWIVTHWWFLMNEPRTPAKNRSDDFDSRHFLDSVSDGYAFPKLQMVPMGEVVQLRWHKSENVFKNAEFLEAGSATVEFVGFRNALQTFVDTVCNRLLEFGITDTVLQSEWDTILSADEEERDYCDSAALLGVDPYEPGKEIAASILAVFERVPTSIYREFLAIASISDLESEAEDILGLLEMRTSRQLFTSLEAVREGMSGDWQPTSSATPWSRGFSAARGLRRVLGLNGDPIGGFKGLANVLHIDPSDMKREVRTHNFRSQLVDGLVAHIQDKEGVGFFIGHRKSQPQLFHFCRGLGEYLAPNRTGPAVVTRASSDRQSINRSFAAEFLAPSSGLRQRVTTDYVEEDEVMELAQEFEVSEFVVLHQLENHDIAATSLSDYRRL